MEFAPIIARQYHFSVGGLAYALTTSVLLVGAINGQNNLLFWLFGLAIAGLIISGVLSGSALMGVRVRREVVSRGVAGEEMHVRYHVHNRNRVFGAFALVIEELPSARNWLGRKHRAEWEGLIAPCAAAVEYVPPRGTVVVEAGPKAIRRGVARLGPVRVSSAFPFGLTRKSVTSVQEQEVILRPAPAALMNGRVLGRATEGASSAWAKPSRQGQDFFSLRDYQPGDSVRSVAWKVSARTGELMVRTLADPPGKRVWLVVDDAMQEANLERGLSVCAGLALAFLSQGRDVGLRVLRGGVLLPPRPGQRQLSTLLDALGTYGTARAVVAREAGRRTGAEAAWVVVHEGAAPMVDGAAVFVAVDRAETYVGGVLPGNGQAAGGASEWSPWIERLRRMALEGEAA